MAGTDPASARSNSGIPGPGNILSTNRLVLLVAVPLFLVLALVAYLTLQFAINERNAQGLVRHTYEVMEAARSLQNNLQTAESSQRGYLIDQDRAYFQAYRQAASLVPGDLDRFRKLTRDNPVQQRRAGRLERLVQDRLNLLATNARNAGATDRATLFANLQEGRRQMNAVRDELNGGLKDELGLLA